VVVGRHSLADSGWPLRIPYGEHLALLVGQGDQLLAQPSIPASFCTGPYFLCGFPVFQRLIFRDWADLHVFRNLGAGRLLMVAAAKKKASRPSRPRTSCAGAGFRNTLMILQSKSEDACVQDRHCRSLNPAGPGAEGSAGGVASGNAPTSFCLDDEAVQGQLDQVGDEITFVHAIGDDAFDRMWTSRFSAVRKT
jgi:hypothetical protein